MGKKSQILLIIAILAIIATITAAIMINRDSYSLKEVKVPLLAPEPNPAGCSDSDGGLNFKEAGTATATLESDSKTDYCLTDSLLKEYFCGSSASIAYIHHNCIFGTKCADGSCV